MKSMKAEIVTSDVIEAAEYIGAAWRQGVEAIIETGRRLIEVRKRFEDEPGKWSVLLARDGGELLLPFKKSYAYRLISIADDGRLSPLGDTLPLDHHALYQLTLLSDDRFAALLEDGRINPSMKRNEASAETRKESKEADERRIMSIAPVEGKYKTIVMDPPWDYEWLSLAGRAQPGYATMTHDELLALDVPAWADDDCHLYLWTTNNFMTRAVDLMAHWGFQHKTVLTWVKPKFGLGSYFRNSTEHVLFGIRGDFGTRADNIATHFEAPLGGHSEKPDIFYDIVERASYPPFGEVFQRHVREAFTDLFEEKVVA